VYSTDVGASRYKINPHLLITVTGYKYWHNCTKTLFRII